jgi:hypothetical protein
MKETPWARVYGEREGVRERERERERQQAWYWPESQRTWTGGSRVQGQEWKYGSGGSHLVILTTQVAEVRRVSVQSQPGQMVLQTLSRKTTGLVEWLKVKGLSSNPSREKKKRSKKKKKVQCQLGLHREPLCQKKKERKKERKVKLASCHLFMCLFNTLLFSCATALLNLLSC